MPWTFSAGETMLLVTTIGGVIVSIVTAIRSQHNQFNMKVSQGVLKEKVEEVHSLTNSRLKSIEEQLAMAKAELQQTLIDLHRAELTTVTGVQQTERELYRRQIVAEMNEKFAADRLALLQRLQPLLPDTPIVVTAPTTPLIIKPGDVVTSAKDREV
jgi:iron-sulfur cluster repair protein YtfE (RIC family)